MKFTAAFITLVAPVLAAPQIPGGGGNAGVLSFGGRLLIASRVMEDKIQAGCLLWKAVAQASNGFPVSDNWGLDRITATFACPSTNEGPSTIALTETSWGDFKGEPTITRMPSGTTVPPRGSKAFELPVTIDLPQAESIFKGTGRKAALKNVELNWMVTLKTGDEPFYWFNLVDNTRIGVGAYSGRVLF